MILVRNRTLKSKLNYFGGQVHVFFLTRAVLGLLSALIETHLYRAVVDAGMPYTARYIYTFFFFSTGLFVSSTGVFFI
jgi:hypothetical protein